MLASSSINGEDNNDTFNNDTPKDKDRYTDLQDNINDVKGFVGI